MQKNFSTFLSADYMMSKNLPYWGESAQPGKTHYLMKLVCDVFSIINYCDQEGYTYMCDEVAAGCKSTDHTLITLGAHAQRGYGSWVRVCVCVSVTQHLTFPMFVCLTNDTTYLTGNEGQNF